MAEDHGDGYTFFRQIPGVGSIEYRPLLPWQIRRIEEMDSQLDDVAFCGRVKSVLAKQIVSAFDHCGAVDPGDLLHRVDLKIIATAITPENCELWNTQTSQNLYEGVILELTAPQFARRKCSDCQRWWYNDETGEVHTKHDIALLRPEGTPTLCQTNEGCPKGTPQNQKSLSPINRLAYDRHLEWKAVGRFPNDPIVMRNAKLIEDAIRQVAGAA